MNIFYVKDKFVPENEAVISVLDLSVLRGYAVFDYVRTYQGRCFHLDDHLARLAYSAKEMCLELPYPLERIKEIILETKAKNNFKEASVKTLITGGVSPNQFSPAAKTTLIVLVYPLSTYPKICYNQGVHTITTPLTRSLPHSKTTGYTQAIVALQHTAAKEALYINGNQQILEGTTSSFFAFKEGVLYTAETAEILLGITQEVILRLSPFPTKREPLTLQDLPLIDEAFISASNKEIMPVISIDNTPVGNGKVGPKTQKLMQRFAQYTKQEDWPPLNIPRYKLSL